MIEISPEAQELKTMGFSEGYIGGYEVPTNCFQVQY